MKNLKGKISLLLSSLAFVFMAVAKLSENNLQDIQSRFLSNIVNYPIQKIMDVYYSLAGRVEVDGWEVKKISFFYFFEQDAIVTFYIASLFASICSIFFAFKALLLSEHSFWVASSLLIVCTTFILYNIYLGIISIIVILIGFEKIRATAI